MRRIFLLAFAVILRPCPMRSGLKRPSLGVVLFVLFCLISVAHAQENSESSWQQLFAMERWEELVRVAATAAPRTAEFDYEYGVALAHLQRWNEARESLQTGRRLAPRDKRFPLELAGVAFKQNNENQAISLLHDALRLDPTDEYANEFLATLYFLYGNLEAALKYWGHIEKPQIRLVSSDPPLRLRAALFDHALAFAPASTLKLDELQASNACLQALEIFPSYRFDLVARPDGAFDTVFRGQEINGCGNTTIACLLRTFRGLPFQEIRPEYFNFRHSAMNVASLFRWDPDKRRVSLGIASPLGMDPRWRFRIGIDGRNENWNVVPSFTGPAPSLLAMNLRREAIAAEISRLVGARWKWSLGAELSHRDFRNVVSPIILGAEVLRNGYQLKQTAGLRYELWQSPEKRIDIFSEGVSQIGRQWPQTSSFEKLQGTMGAHWLPRSRGDDFATEWRLRGGKTFGPLPFDEFYMLGLERDNDLWMRAHIGDRDGRKGSAPLGRNYFLSNWETDKNLFTNGFLTLKLGMFFDAGKISSLSPGPRSQFGPQQWLADTGLQLRVRVLGVGAGFSYGKDLRTGNNAFYVTALR